MEPAQTPPGAISSDTKDVVPAKLAEGEFVIPANVVRYIGMDKLRKMMMKAEEEMGAMQELGQIGGAAAPSPEGQSQARAFAEGGIATQSTFNPNQYGTVGSTLFGQPQQVATPNTEVKNYVNAEGKILPVTFVDGKPTTAIPEGYYLQGSTPPAKNQNPAQPEPYDNTGDQSTEQGKPRGAFGGRNPFELSREELAGEVDNIRSGLEMIQKAGQLGGGLASLNPVLGAAAMIGMQVAKGSAISNLNRAAMVAEARGDATMAESIRTGLGEYTDGRLDKLFAQDNPGAQRFARDRESYLSSGRSITPYGSEAGPATTTVSSSNRSGGLANTRERDSGRADDRSDPVSRTSEVTSHSSTPGDFTSSPSSSSSSSGGGKSFGGNTPSAPSRGESFSNTPGDFNSGSGGLSFKSGGLVTRK